MKLHKLILGAVMLLSQQSFSQETANNNNEWKSGRPDGHAPISVMADHYHGKGDIMFSYRYMNMGMSDLQQNGNSITNQEGHDAGYMVTPLDMTMGMHMLGMMYAPTNNITLLAMANYYTNDMDLQMQMMGMNTEFSTASSGFGDVKLGLLYKFINNKRQSLHGLAVFSLPTGSLEAMDVTPMSSPNETLLPYPMQLGSGTFDADLGLTYLGQTDLLSWGSQLKATYRLGRNEYDYSLGNRYSLNSWFAVKTNDWLSFSARIEGTATEKINGANPNLTTMIVTTADPANFGGYQVNGGLGFNIYAFKGSLKNVRFGAEYALPVYQDLNGIQLEQTQTITLGLQYSL